MGIGWRQDEIKIDIVETEGSLVIIDVATPVGRARLLGDVRLSGKVLEVDAAHIEGLTPGAVGRAGINAVLRKLMVEADVEQIVIQGATRTTGKGKGRLPRPIRFPHRGSDRAD